MNVQTFLFTVNGFRIWKTLFELHVRPPGDGKRHNNQTSYNMAKQHTFYD